MERAASLIIFVLAYVFFVIFPHRRSITAVAASVLILAVMPFVSDDPVTPVKAFGFIHWNVMGVFFGVLVLADLLMKSNMPAVLAERLIEKSPNAAVAMLLICALSSAVSMFAENVATVLLIAPLAVETARKLKISPVLLMIGVAISSNLQGTATLIGDPPSMILAANQHMTFNDFFVYQGRLSIFFFVEFGAIASFVVLYLFYRKNREAVAIERHEKLQSIIPSILMGTLVLALVVSSFIDPDFTWLSGTCCMAWAVGGIVWHVRRYGGVWNLLRHFDWDTTFFLMGVFVLVSTLTHAGWIDHVTAGIKAVTGDSLAAEFFVLVVASVVVSGFVDNVPYLMAMIPVAQSLAEGPERILLLFGLLIASCIGGNISPIGASANIVTVGYLRRQGYTVTFRTFMKLGIPFTLVATAAASALLWLVWG